eukprot:scaffold5539_cov126-Isochrysis_galbana.AAC.2
MTRFALRCVEYHRVSPSGSLPFQGHHDAGSLLTIDVLLSTSAADFDRGDSVTAADGDGGGGGSVTAADFEGGEFVTAEDGGHRATHAFGRGDALVFVRLRKMAKIVTSGPMCPIALF